MSRIEETTIPIGVEDNSSGPISAIEAKLQELQKEAEAAQKKIDGTSKALDDMDASGPNKVADGMDNAAQASQRLQTSAEKVADSIQKGFTVAGAKINDFANSTSQAFTEASRDGAQALTALNSVGLGGAIGDVQKLATQLAGLKGLDDDPVTAQLSNAIGKGRLGGLSEVGIILDASAKQRIKDANATSAQAGAQQTLTEVLRQGAAAVQDLSANTDPAVAKLGAMDVRLGNLAETAGSAGVAVKASIEGGILEPLVTIAEKSPAAVQALGAIAQVVGPAFSAVGQGLDWGAKFGQSLPVLRGVFDWLKALRGARVADASTAVTSAVTTNTAVATEGATAYSSSLEFDKLQAAKRAEETVALGTGIAGLESEGDAALVDAGKFEVLKKAKQDAAGVPAGGVGVGNVATEVGGVIPTGAGKTAVTTTTNVVEGAGGAAAAGGIKGLWGRFAGMFGKGAATEGVAVGGAEAGTAVASAGGSVALRALGTFTERLPLLGATIAALDGARLLWSARTKTDKQLAEEGDGSIALNTPTAANAFGLLPGQGSTLAFIRSHVGLGIPDKPAPATTTTPTAAPVAALPPSPILSASGVPFSAASPAMAPPPPMPPSFAAVGAASSGDEDPYAEQLIALRRQKSDLKGKSNAAARADLEQQIRAVEDSQRAWKESHKEQMKAERAGETASKKEEAAAKREGKEAEKRDSVAARDAADIASLQRENAENDKEAGLQDQIDQAKKQGNAAQVRALTLQLETSKADEKRQDELGKAALEEDGAHRAALVKEANLRYQGAIKTATRTANKAVLQDKNLADARLREQFSFRRRDGVLRDFGQGGATGVGSPISVSASDYMFKSFPLPIPAAPSLRSDYPMDTTGMRPQGGERTVAGQVSQDANGEFRVRFADIVIPNQSIGAMRGRKRF